MNSQKGAPKFADSGSNIVKELEVLYKTRERFVIVFAGIKFGDH